MSENNKYGIWIKIIYVAIPVIVAILFGVRVDYELPIFLPPIYSSLNALCLEGKAIPITWAYKSYKYEKVYFCFQIVCE